MRVIRSSPAVGSGAGVPVKPLPQPARATGPASGRAYVPDPELAQFAALLRQQAAGRPGAVEEAAARLARGDYQAPAAAARTAAALLRD